MVQFFLLVSRAYTYNVSSRDYIIISWFISLFIFLAFFFFLCIFFLYMHRIKTKGIEQLEEKEGEMQDTTDQFILMYHY